MTTPDGLPPTGRLVVDCSWGLLWALAAHPPRIEINGQPVNAGWGPWTYDLPAGNYGIRVRAGYLGLTGRARTQVAVYPGQVTTVFYRAPHTGWVRGSIGLQPQRANWGLLFIIVMAAVLGLFLGMFLVNR